MNRNRHYVCSELCYSEYVMVIVVITRYYYRITVADVCNIGTIYLYVVMYRATGFSERNYMLAL